MLIHFRRAIPGPTSGQWLPTSLLALIFLQITGCASVERTPAVPSALTQRAAVLGIPNARFWPDVDASVMLEEAKRARERESAERAQTYQSAPEPPANFLAISGGSDNGAFGAGLLVGWTRNGQRPSFKIVTGISTGALVAPFAFLGSAYDGQLREVYTGIGPDDIYEKRNLLSAVFSESLADTAPLFRLISRYANAEMLAAIANEYRKGRLLLIATTNIDVQRPVIWNMGAIAASGRPDALELFRKILLASAAVPGLFPPVMIDVEAGGQGYQEMHVDGGAVAQTFLYPPQIGRIANLRRGDLARQRHAYIIRCGRLDPDWSSVEPHLLPIAGRAISTMIHYSGYNDILRIYSTTQHDGVDYNLAYIAPDFNAEHREDFNTAYMKALFDYGYQKAVKGYPWHKAPPILTDPKERQASAR